MKTIFTAIFAVISIILVQIGLTYAFSFHTGEVFSKTAITALFFYFLCRSFRKRAAA